MDSNIKSQVHLWVLEHDSPSSLNSSWIGHKKAHFCALSESKGPWRQDKPSRRQGRWSGGEKGVSGMWAEELAGQRGMGWWGCLAVRIQHLHSGVRTEAVVRQGWNPGCLNPCRSMMRGRRGLRRAFLCAPHTPPWKEHKRNQERKGTAGREAANTTGSRASIFNGTSWVTWNLVLFIRLLRDQINEHPTSFALQMEHKLSTNRKLSWIN